MADLDRSLARDLPQHSPHEGGLARTVSPHEGNLVAPLDRQVNAVEDVPLTVVGDPHILSDKGVGAGGDAHGEAEVDRLAVDLVDLYRVDLLQRLDPGLHLGRLRRLVPKALDEVLGLLDHLLLILVGSLLLLKALLPQLLVVRVIDLKVIRLPHRDLHGAGGGIVKKSPVV